MSRGRWMYDPESGQVLPAHEVMRKKEIERARKRSSLEKPYVIGDCMDAIRHPSTGEFFESKSEFRKVTRSLGLTEVGNESFPEKKYEPLPDLAQDISRAYDELSGN